ncbi:14013_t:CDS:1 [Racocetra fulgida]|uniref:14013_t:CDS:1 n=1 Tax=Racocetra fulgida TaxID=60492 RepID=A0A9N9DEK6_9GLOM|nr:14013_t:CDS:1 [Racocetra fulgida]
MAQQRRVSRSSANISFNNPSAPGTHNFRIGSSEPTEHQPDQLRVAFLEYQIADLKFQNSFVIQENNNLRSQLSSFIQEHNNLRSQVAALQDLVEVQQIAISISNKEFIEEFSFNSDQISADDKS